MGEYIAGPGVRPEPDGGAPAGPRLSLRGRRIAVATLALYLGSVVAIALSLNSVAVFPLAYVGLFAFAWLWGRPRQFLVDWLPVPIIVLSYYIAGAIITGGQVPANVHITDIIALEERLFGNPIPSIRLQGWLYHRGTVMPWDVMASLFYVTHYGVPIGFGLWLWIKSRGIYWRYTGAMLLLFLTGFTTYLVYPAMPPWLASQQGYLEPMPRVLILTLARFVPTSPEIYNQASANAVAAIPSLHVAYPLLAFLVWSRLRPGWPTALACLYPLGVIFSVVYLGEHYVVDVLLGAAYALVAFWLVWDVLPIAARFWAYLGRPTREAQLPT